ncbi:MAG: aldo/keto reductase [Microbacteriaceae bacterium]|jgi:2,5-diketo-D-gluconate reductase A|nr:aldo/keto reductase [Microbacteriaceae bacterium]MCI1207026.1 aldo/keto reductase [Microbacteriaceae bacterium]
MSTNVPSITLNTGAAMPQIGLGVWQASPEETVRAVRYALSEAGYRHIDTAKIYGNEEGVGQGIAESGVPRDEIFLTTKLWNADQGYDSTLRAFDASLERLGTDYVDLYLIHWPLPDVPGSMLETWRALETIAAEGRARAIGVCNQKPHHLQQILDRFEVVPAVNQIELHPHLPQYLTRAFDAAHGIATESWSPLGGTPRSGWGRKSRPNTLLTDPVIAQIAAAHGKSAAQVLIRWHLENGLIVIPKSVHEERIAENIDVFDFTLTGEEFEAIGALDTGERVGSDPDQPRND